MSSTSRKENYKGSRKKRTALKRHDYSKKKIISDENFVPSQNSVKGQGQTSGGFCERAFGTVRNCSENINTVPYDGSLCCENYPTNLPSLPNISKTKFRERNFHNREDREDTLENVNSLSSESFAQGVKDFENGSFRTLTNYLAHLNDEMNLRSRNVTLGEQESDDQDESQASKSKLHKNQSQNSEVETFNTDEMLPEIEFLPPWVTDPYYDINMFSEPEENFLLDEPEVENPSMSGLLIAIPSLDNDVL